VSEKPQKWLCITFLVISHESFAVETKVGDFELEFCCRLFSVKNCIYLSL